MAKKVIDPAPIIKDLAEWCLKAKGLECSVLGSVIDKLKAAPRADAVEVVRCRECYFGKRELICTNPKCTKSFYGCPVPPEHYCSYGERERQ